MKHFLTCLNSTLTDRRTLSFNFSLTLEGMVLLGNTQITKSFLIFKIIFVLPMAIRLIMGVGLGQVVTEMR
jgi:hypothetical protein